MTQNTNRVFAAPRDGTGESRRVLVPVTLQHTPALTNVQLPVSTERYGREAHPHFAVVVRGPLTLLHRTSNFMTFHPIFASSFLEVPGEPRPGGQTLSYLRKASKYAAAHSP